MIDNFTLGVENGNIRLMGMSHSVISSLAASDMELIALRYDRPHDTCEILEVGDCSAYPSTFYRSFFAALPTSQILVDTSPFSVIGPHNIIPGFMGIVPQQLFTVSLGAYTRESLFLVSG